MLLIIKKNLLHPQYIFVYFFHFIQHLGLKLYWLIPCNPQIEGHMFCLSPYLWGSSSSLAEEIADLPEADMVSYSKGYGKDCLHFLFWFNKEYEEN